MHESIARGLMRQHIRQGVPLNQARQQEIGTILEAITSRVIGGRVISNPTGTIAKWRSNFASNGAHIVPLGQFRRVAAFWPAWANTCQDITVVIETKDSVTKQKIQDEEFFVLMVMADGLSLDRKEVTSGTSLVPVQVDRHALQRWLQRQPGGDIPGFERGVMGLLPIVALQQTLFDGDYSIGNALPLGDGLLLGNLCGRWSMAEDAIYGVWGRARAGKILGKLPSLPVGAGRIVGQKIYSPFYSGQTFFGPQQLDRGLLAVRARLLDWQCRHAASLELMWAWLGEALLTNQNSALPAAVESAREQLFAIMESDLWCRHVVERSARAIARSYGREMPKAVA